MVGLRARALRRGLHRRELPFELGPRLRGLSQFRIGRLQDSLELGVRLDRCRQVALDSFLMLLYGRDFTAKEGRFRLRLRDRRGQCGVLVELHRQRRVRLFQSLAALLGHPPQLLGCTAGLGLDHGGQFRDQRLDGFVRRRGGFERLHRRLEGGPERTQVVQSAVGLFRQQPGDEGRGFRRSVIVKLHDQDGPVSRSCATRDPARSR